MLNSIIINYLKDNNRLVVPNFGAFIKKSDGAGIIFSQLLKADDGVLASLVMQKYSLERPVAIEMINKYVSQIRQKTLVAGDYQIVGLGEFTLGDDGVFSFNAINSPKREISTETEKIITPESRGIKQEQDVAKPKESPFIQSIGATPQKKGLDLVMIIAITVTAIAVLIIAYGVVFSNVNDIEQAPALQLDVQTTTQQ